MHHVLRCWERQSDGIEYKKTLRRPGSALPRWGSLQRSHKTPKLVGRSSLRPPQKPHPRSRPFGPRLSYPHSKISSNTLVENQ